MASPNPPISLYGYGLLIIGSIVMMATSLGTTHWIELNVSSLRYNFGLFEYCTDSKCVKYEDLKTYSLSNLDVTIGLCITAVVLYAVSMVIIAHLVFVQKLVIQSKNHGWSSLSLLIVAAIIAWAGVGKFTNDNDELNGINPDVEWKYGYSLYLASLSGVLAILAGIFSVLTVSFLFRNQQPQGIVFQNPQPAVNVVTSPQGFGYPPPIQHPGTTVVVGSNQAYAANPPPYTAQKQFY